MSCTSYTLSGLKANLYGLLFAVPAILFAGVPYIIIWCDLARGLPDGILPVIHRNMTVIQKVLDVPWSLAWVLAALFVGIVLHEALHGIVMAVFAKNGWKSVSFGFNIKVFAP